MALLVRTATAVAGVALMACTTSPSRGTVAAAADVRAALDGFFVAATQLDWVRVDSILAPEFQFYTDSAVVLTRAEFLDAMRQDAMQVSNMAFHALNVTVSPDEQFAIARYQLTLDAALKGEPYSMRSAETVAFRREGARWLMTHNHASVRLGQ